MHIDFHCHSVITKKLGFDLDKFQEMAEAAGKNKLDTICLTEHFNTYRFSDIYDHLDAAFPYEAYRYAVDGVDVIPGIEVDVAEGVHLLFAGDREDIRELRRRLEPHQEQPAFIGVERLLELEVTERLLRIVAHPLRPGRGLSQLPEHVYSRFDALDLNAKDLHTQGMGMWSRMHVLAEKLDIPLVAGSDSHHYLQLGSVYTAFHERLDSLEAVRTAIRARAYDLEVSPCLDVKVQSARVVKNVIKQWRLPERSRRRGGVDPN
jgi:predicted metal-dependent phosphoesterase TrpH